MPAGWAAAAAAVGTIGSAAMGADAAGDAAAAQRGAAGAASQVQQHMYDTSRRDQMPFMQGGYGAFSELLRGMGIAPQNSTGGAAGSAAGRPLEELILNENGVPTMNSQLYESDPAYRSAWDSVLQQERSSDRWKDPNAETYYTGGTSGDFTRLGAAINSAMGAYRAEHPEAGTVSGTPGASGVADAGGSGIPTGYLSQTFGPQQFLAGMDPGYGFRLQQGAQGVMNQAAAGSGALSGPAIKALLEYNQGAASQEYNSAFNRFQTQQGNIFGRLSSIAGLGQNAAAGVGNQGVATGANIGNNIIGAGNAAAAGQIGAANAWGSALSDLGSYGSWWAMNRNQQATGP